MNMRIKQSSLNTTAFREKQRSRPFLLQQEDQGGCIPSKIVGIVSIDANTADLVPRGVFSLAGPVAETFVYVGILVHPAKQKHNELKTAARHGAGPAGHPTERVGDRCRQIRARRIANIQIHLDQVEREPRKG